jgi:hypothetical protein
VFWKFRLCSIWFFTKYSPIQYSQPRVIWFRYTYFRPSPPIKYAPASEVIAAAAMQCPYDPIQCVETSAYYYCYRIKTSRANIVIDTRPVTDGGRKINDLWCESFFSSSSPDVAPPSERNRFLSLSKNVSISFVFFLFILFFYMNYTFLFFFSSRTTFFIIIIIIIIVWYCFCAR